MTKTLRKFLRKAKKDYFSKINPRKINPKDKLVSGNKNFWRIIKPYFSNKGNSNKIMISEKDCIVSDDRKLSEIFKEYFINITKTFDLKPSIVSTTASLPEIIKTFKDHPSVKTFFLRAGRSVSSTFILSVKMKLERLF